MINFKQFLYKEAGPPPPMPGPSGGSGMPTPGGMPPMPGGGLGGMPPMPGGGLGGGMPPMGPDPMGGMPGGAPGQPPQQSKPVEIEFLDVWRVLEKLIEEKPEEDKNYSGFSDGNMVKNNEPKNPTNLLK